MCNLACFFFLVCFFVLLLFLSLVDLLFLLLCFPCFFVVASYSFLRSFRVYCYKILFIIMCVGFFFVFGFASFRSHIYISKWCVSVFFFFSLLFVLCWELATLWFFFWTFMPMLRMALLDFFFFVNLLSRRRFCVVVAISYLTLFQSFCLWVFFFVS